MYKFTPRNVIIRTADNAHIPIVDGNSDYAKYQKWVSDGGVTLPAEQGEIAEAQRIERYESDRQSANGYTKLDNLKGMTPAQIVTWANNNVTNMAQAQDAIKTLAIAVSVLARRM